MYVYGFVRSRAFYRLRYVTICRFGKLLKAAMMLMMYVYCYCDFILSNVPRAFPFSSEGRFAASNQRQARRVSASVSCPKVCASDRLTILLPELLTHAFSIVLKMPFILLYVYL
ncbi:hypothetical protein EDB83DRAFT_2391349 [Lactarius deliciosus]|nr:hypothetical protein EDB83DRAFT_2391349 [Lactarius deliciosus]